MRLPTRSSMVAGVSALLIVATSQWAAAGDKSNEAGIWQDSDMKVRGGSTSTDRGPTHMPGKPWVEPNPADEKPSAPVPEPGTMALATLGLMSLGAALRKRRAARPATGETRR